MIIPKRALLCITALWCLTGAGVYKWTDANGIVHYSSTPPPASQPVEKTGFTTSRSERTDHSLDEVLTGTWYAKRGNNLIQLYISTPRQDGRRYQWLETLRQSKVRDERGLLRSFEQRLELTLDQGGTRTLTVRDASPSLLTLADSDADEILRFRQVEPPRYKLNANESAMEGYWAEVAPRAPTQAIRKIRFENGHFERFSADRHERWSSPPNPNATIAKGNWRVEDDVVVLDYIQASKALADKALQEEQWRIEQLDGRNLILRQDMGSQRLHFVRERSE